MTGNDKCGVSQETLLRYVADKLRITPAKLPAKFPFVDATNPKRTPKELSEFLGLPVPQATRFGSEVPSDNRQKIKRLVTWLSCVVKHVAQMVPIIESPKTTNQVSQVPAWKRVMGRVTSQLKIKPIISSATNVTRASSTDTSTNTSTTASTCCSTNTSTTASTCCSTNTSTTASTCCSTNTSQPDGRDTPDAEVTAKAAAFRADTDYMTGAIPTNSKGDVVWLYRRRNKVWVKATVTDTR